MRTRSAIILSLVLTAGTAGLRPAFSEEPSTSPAKRMLVVGDPRANPVLPPDLPWNGLSRKLALPAGDPRSTPFEKEGMNRTPRYAEMIAWLEELAERAPEVKLVSWGTSPQGRELWMAVVSATGAETPAALHEGGRAVVWIQGALHGDEPEGKDAGSMLARDLAAGGSLRPLLEKASLIFVPVVNPDGHERFSRYGSFGQRGPEETGRRNNSRNLDLDLDFLKADAVEVRALLAAWQVWQPDLILDVHSRRATDDQYDITWGYNGPHTYAANGAAWLDTYLTPSATRDLEAHGHTPGELVRWVDPEFPEQGRREAVLGPETAVGYAGARRLPAVRVETQGFRSYERRVLGTRVLLETTFRAAGNHGRELQGAEEADARARPRTFVLEWGDALTEGRTLPFKGETSVTNLSPVSGGTWMEWQGMVRDVDILRVSVTEPIRSVSSPRAWWVAAGWEDVVALLEIHGVEVERGQDAVTVEGAAYRFDSIEWGDGPRQGRWSVQATPIVARGPVEIPEGAVRIPSDQPLATLAALLLEPSCPQSLFAWGFFNGIADGNGEVPVTVLEPTAIRMVQDDPEVAREFRRRLRDPEFMGDESARRFWLYRQTPYFDERWMVLPVVREE